MYTFFVINPKKAHWNTIESSYDSTCFHTKKWNEYLSKTGTKTYIAEIVKNEKNIGYFVGEKIGFIINFITAPIEGSGTYTQGLCLQHTISEKERVEIYQALAEWLFKTKQAYLLQVDDWQLRRTSPFWIPNEELKQQTLDELNIPYSVRPTLCVPVNTSIEEMWSHLHYKSCKYSINKAKKLGLYVKLITNFEEIDRFTKIHYSQLKEVCAKQGMRPKSSQSQKRMKVLCESLFPDRVIMLEIIGKDETGTDQIMSSGIFCQDKGQCIYWTGASYQRYQKYCPNELMVWEAMCKLHELGAGELNLGGMATYKRKFGSQYEYVPRIAFAKYSWMLRVLPWIKKQYHHGKALLAKIKGRKSFK